MADVIAFAVIVFLILTGYGFWFYQLLKFAYWIGNKLENRKSDEETKGE